MEKPINPLDQIASTLGQQDEGPNIQLAEAIVEAKDEAAVKELVRHLSHKNKAIQNDCIKVLYEIGERNPALISDYTEVFLALLTHKNNRLQWGAMTALHCITRVDPSYIHSKLPEIMAATEKGSVITRDQAVNILIQLTAMAAYAETAYPILLEQIRTCPTNQLPMYAERAVRVIHGGNKDSFVQALDSRLGEMEKESKRNRIEKVIRRVSKILPD